MESERENTLCNGMGEMMTDETGPQNLSLYIYLYIIICSNATFSQSTWIQKQAVTFNKLIKKQET